MAHTFGGTQTPPGSDKGRTEVQLLCPEPGLSRIGSSRCRGISAVRRGEKLLLHRRPPRLATAPALATVGCEGLSPGLEAWPPDSGGVCSLPSDWVLWAQSFCCSGLALAAGPPLTPQLKRPWPRQGPRHRPGGSPVHPSVPSASTAFKAPLKAPPPRKSQRSEVWGAACVPCGLG